MGDIFQATWGAWMKAAEVFESNGPMAGAELSGLLAETTNPAACGAANGLATVDGAVAMMLTAFNEVMSSEVINDLGAGLVSEGELMASTGLSLRDMEEEATEIARRLGE